MLAAFALCDRDGQYLRFQSVLLPYAEAGEPARALISISAFIFSDADTGQGAEQAQASGS